MSNWLDGLIGWDKEFNKIETVLPDDPAIDHEASDMEKYFEDNFNTEHVKFKAGEKPVKVTLELPTPAQYSSIVPHLRDMEESGDEAMLIVCHKLFELCVRFPESEKFKPEFRHGFYRLPEAAMSFFASKRPIYIQYFGSWLLNKYVLSDEEKKA
ncbi:ribonucleotide reductase [Rhodobacteraceae phage LS06-2018-MD06]|jgi:hypothetical protein|nr:ribonucleotide reductase [Rhodobacteraceae phage LS06-2018-MD06]